METLVKNVAEHLNEEIDEISKRQQEKFREYDQNISSLPDENKSLRQKVDKQEQYQIKNNIRIYGDEEIDGENVHNSLNKKLKVTMNDEQSKISQQFIKQIPSKLWSPPWVELFFSIFIVDLPQNLEHSKSLLSADDLKFYRKVEN
ncbi:hypothetical protein JTB14_016773 [Gonioctena quinquepunctata]|nr:hypothetical protein JTB14_016773 [Gonioctena quinquepunctata]